MQLTAQLFILAYELGIFLFELADAQRWWWERRDLFGRERKRRLELCHGLLELCEDDNQKINKRSGHGGIYMCAGEELVYLLDVGLSFCAMPRLGLCITTALRAVTANRGRVVGCCLCHGGMVVLRVEKKSTRYQQMVAGVCECVSVSVSVSEQDRVEGGDCRD